MKFWGPNFGQRFRCDASEVSVMFHWNKNLYILKCLIPTEYNSDPCSDLVEKLVKVAIVDFVEIFFKSRLILN